MIKLSDEKVGSENDIKILMYVLKILKDSRTKKRAQNRIEGLLQLRKEQFVDCHVFSDEEIENYIRKEQRK